MYNKRLSIELNIWSQLIQIVFLYCEHSSDLIQS